MASGPEGTEVLNYQVRTTALNLFSPSHSRENFTSGVRMCGQRPGCSEEDGSPILPIPRCIRAVVRTSRHPDTTVLKVSIHCEGCKKKVRKVLQGVEGVYSIDINSKQNKVTVTGSTDAESLIRRLIKYGKHAELWPEKKPAATISSGSEAAGDADTKPEAPVPKTEQQPLNTEKQQQPEELSNETIPSPPTESTETAPAAVEAGPSDKADELEKEGKQTQKETSSIDESAVANTNTSGNTAAAPEAAGVSPPPPPEKFPLNAQQVDSVSNRAVQPSTSYAYYMYSPAAASSYTYSGDQPPSVYPPENYMSDPYYGSMEAPARSGASYDMFNDENPNACRVM